MGSRAAFPGRGKWNVLLGMRTCQAKMMMISSLLVALSVTALAPALAQAPPVNPEAAIVEYLRTNVRPGAPVVVSKLFNEVFTSEAERKVLNRLFNTFFKIPLFIVQAQKAKGMPPTLKEISEQFAFTVSGEADVILRIMESDPRMPKFLERDPLTGEILRADVEKILAASWNVVRFVDVNRAGGPA